MRTYDFTLGLSRIIWKAWGSKLNTIGGPGKNTATGEEDTSMLVEMKNGQMFRITVEEVTE